MLSLVVLIMIHKSVFTSVNFQLDNYKLDLQFSSENCHSVLFLQQCFFRTKLWHFDDIFSPLSESYYNLLRDVISPPPPTPPCQDFSVIPTCLTAALQELFWAAGIALTPVCQGEAGMIEEGYDPARTGEQHLLFFAFYFIPKKSW